MKWKEVAVGAVASLIVAILSGVAVYYWTKEPDSKKSELLFYSTNPTTSFNGGTTKLGVNVAQIRNDGGVPARNVVFLIGYMFSEIKDFSVNSSSGVKPKTRSVDKRTAEFTFDTLVPSEIVTIGILTDSNETPVIVLRSDSSIGKAQERILEKSNDKSKLNTFSIYLIPILGIFALISLIPLLANRRIIVESDEGEYEHSSSKNNVAFLLLHQGLLVEAEAILDNAMLLGEDPSFTLSNMAVCKAHVSQFDDADSMIRAAVFYAVDEHTKALVSFNDALVSLMKGNLDDFYAKLKIALIKSPDEIRKYCDFSVYLSDIRGSAQFTEVFQ